MSGTWDVVLGATGWSPRDPVNSVAACFPFLRRVPDGPVGEERHVFTYYVGGTDDSRAPAALLRALEALGSRGEHEYLLAIRGPYDHALVPYGLRDGRIVPWPTPLEHYPSRYTRAELGLAEPDQDRH